MLFPMLNRPLSQLSQKLPLRLVLVVPFILQIFAAVGLTGYISFRNGEQAIREVVQKLQAETGDRIQQTLTNYLEAPQALNQINTNAIKLGQLNLQETGSLTRQFWYQRFLFNSVMVSAIYFGSAEGEFFGLGFQDDQTWQIGRAGISTAGKFHSYAIDQLGNPTNLLQIGKDYDPRIRPWYQKAVKAGRSTWSDIYIDFKEPRLKLTLAEPIYTASGTLQGVVGVDFVISHIQAFLRSLKIGKSGHTFILEPSGEIVASSTSEEPVIRDQNGKIKARLFAKDSRIPLIKAATQHLNQTWQTLHNIQTRQQLTVELNHTNHFLQVTPLKDSRGINWLIVVIIPESDFMAQIHANTRTTIWLCLGALILATLLGILTARWIAMPVLFLSAATQRITSGELDKNVPIVGVKELRILANSFNQMASQLQASFIALEKTKEELEIRVQERTAALSQSEAQNRAIIAAIPDLMIRLSREGFYLDFIPPKSAGALLMTREELIGKHISEVLPADIVTRQLQFIEQAIVAGESQVYEHQLWNNGALYEEEVRIVISGENEALLIIRDITERKRLEKELSQASRFLNSIVENIPLALFVKDACNDFRYVLWNRAAEDVYAIPREKVLGYNLYDIAELELAEQLEIEHLQLMKEGKLIIAEEIFDSKFKGKLWQRVMKLPLINDQGEVTHLMYIAEDITERKKAEAALRLAQEQSERLLLNILPKAIAERLKKNTSSIAELFDEATILFADIVGFTPLSARTSPIDLVNLLNQIFSTFDELAEQHGLEKIKTIGDAYMVAGGLPVPRPDHAEAVADMALDMIAAIARFQGPNRADFQIRIGINTGPVVAGVIGIKKFIYDLWGDTVNIASRMESQGVAGNIQVTATTYEYLKERFHLEKRGEISVKGKGEMTTYWLTGHKEN